MALAVLDRPLVFHGSPPSDFVRAVRRAASSDTLPVQRIHMDRMMYSIDWTVVLTQHGCADEEKGTQYELMLPEPVDNPYANVLIHQGNT